MSMHIGEILLLGWLWNLTWGGYYLLILVISLFVMLLRARVAIWSSVVLSLGVTLCALLAYTALMALVDFIESLLFAHYTYTTPTHSWAPAVIFFSIYSLLQFICFLCVRARYHLSWATMLWVVLISNSIALCVASLLPPLVLR